MITLLIKILLTVLIGLLLGCKEFLSFIGISYIIDMIHYAIIISETKGKGEDE